MLCYVSTNVPFNVKYCKIWLVSIQINHHYSFPWRFANDILGLTQLIYYHYLKIMIYKFVRWFMYQRLALTSVIIYFSLCERSSNIILLPNFVPKKINHKKIFTFTTSLQNYYVSYDHINSFISFRSLSPPSSATPPPASSLP